MEIVGVAVFVLLAAMLVALLVARFAFTGPCPRCGAFIPRRMLDCPSCGFCVRAARK